MIRHNHNKRINLSKSVFFFHRCCEKSLKIPVFLYLYCGFWLFQQNCCGQPRLAAGVTGTTRIRAGRSGPRGQELTHQESREGKRKMRVIWEEGTGITDTRRWRRREGGKDEGRKVTTCGQGEGDGMGGRRRRRANRARRAADQPL